jgi:O-antigen/teichoic acid export membrane protein
MVFLSRSGNSFLTLIFSLIAGRLLTVEDHGLYGQSLARIVIIQALTEVGLQYSLVRYMSPAVKNGDWPQVRDIAKASLLLKLIALLLTGAVLLVLTFQYSIGGVGIDLFLIGTHPDRILLVWLIFLGGAGMSMISYLDAILVTYQRYFRLSLWLPATGILRLLFLGGLVILDNGAVRAEHVVYSFSLAPYIAIVIFFFFFPARFFFEAMGAKGYRPWIGKLFAYNLWILAASFFSITSDWMEILLISNERDSGLYNAVRMPMQGFLILLATMQSILLPRFSGLEKKEEYLALFKRVYLFIIPGAISLIPVMWVFVWFIPYWYGQEYLSSIGVLYLLYPNYLMRILFAPLGTALFALDQPRIIMIESGLRMVFGLLLNLILIPLYGIMGAAIASLLSQFSGWAFLIYCYYLYFRTDRFPMSRG